MLSTRFLLSGLMLISTAAASACVPHLKPCVPDATYNSSILRWEWSPNPGPLNNGDVGKYLRLSSGVDIWYTTMGPAQSKHTPVLILHGGTGNSNQMYHQANMLAKTRLVILQDTRGQGRSPYANFTDFHYDDMARDAIELIDHLEIPRVSVVGWSDGAITGLDLAMNYTSRIDRVFAHGANNQADMSNPGTNDPIINSDSGTFNADHDTNGTTFSTKAAEKRKRSTCVSYDCESLSPLPARCDAMASGVSTMWDTEPTWGPEALGKISCPVWIVDGDHDGAIERNQPDAMAAWIPYAGQLILPQAGHFALLEDPIFFNFAVQYFLDMSYDGVYPMY